MTSLRILFLDCAAQPSPEISHTGALWAIVADLYHQQGCDMQCDRVIDRQLLPETLLLNESNDEFSLLYQQIQRADILIIGVPVRHGLASSQCQLLLERLGHMGPTPLLNIVLGLVVVSDALGSSGCVPQICYSFNRLGCINPPHSVVAWTQPLDTLAEFTEANGHSGITVNQEARLLVETSMALATLLQQTPITVNRCGARDTGRAIATAAAPPAVTFLTPKTIRTETNPDPDGIDYRHLTKRIWTVMQEGMRRGFAFKILSLVDRTYRAERDGKGFIYKIYPGHFSFRIQYKDFDYEQRKSHKLKLMAQDGLAVPRSYGTFATAAEIPFDQLTFPLVAKPDFGSLSQHVFPHLQTVDQLKQAAAIIEADGSVIKLESHISGWDYRVLVINHQFAGCVQRRPASIVGDGNQTIRDLFQLRNQEPGRADRYESHTTLHQLVCDRTTRQLLHRAGYTLDTVLPQGQRFYLQNKITAATGADYVDCTDQLHPSIIKSCIDFSYRFTTLTLGFDLITSDISRPLAETGGAFNEYNFLPYVDLHENCNEGQQRPVCRLIWDHVEANADTIVTSDFNPF